MLYINDKIYEITTKTISVGNFNKSCKKGYNICINLLFVDYNTKEKGYINLDAGYNKSSEITVFLNKKYCSSTANNQYLFFELFDTKSFYESDITSEIYLEIKNKINNKIDVNFEINDKFIKVKFDGLLNIDDKIVHDTFSS